MDFICAEDFILNHRSHGGLYGVYWSYASEWATSYRLYAAVRRQRYSLEKEV